MFMMEFQTAEQTDSLVKASLHTRGTKAQRTAVMGVCVLFEAFIPKAHGPDCVVTFCVIVPWICKAAPACFSDRR